MKRRSLILLTAAFLLLRTAGPYHQTAGSDIPSPEDEYFIHKKAGNYREALDVLLKWTAALDDPTAIEVNLFRISELMAYPELYDRGLEVLNSIEKTIGPANRFLTDRIDIIKILLYLKKGDIRTAESMLRILSFLDFQVIGPFQNGGTADFNRSYPPELGFDQQQTYDGKAYAVSWFPAAPDRAGTIDFGDLYGDTVHSFFYLHRAITIQNQGEYYFILGKTGYTDLWIDGARMFSSRNRHGFNHGQYFIKVYLPRGPHRILIKAGDSGDGMTVSLRIASADGTRFAAIARDNSSVVTPGNLRSISYFPGLAALMKIKNPDAVTMFNAGYLLLASRLFNTDNNLALRYLSAIPDDYARYPSACFYGAQAETNADAKARLLERSILADPKNMEALRKLAMINISSNFIYEAFPIIESMKKINMASPWCEETLARLFIKRGWIAEALRHAGALKESRYPSLGYRLEARAYRLDKDYFRESQDLERFMTLDRYDISCCRDLLSCYERTGAMDATERLLHRSVALYPNSIPLKLRLAKIIQTGRGPAPALPYYAAALKISPGSSSVLEAIGVAYHKLGKPSSAAYYLTLALKHDPVNFGLARYLNIITGREDETGRYALRKDIPGLAASAAAFRDEPAVILLDENIISVNTDGSFERRVRKTAMVNARSEVSNFNNQSIILDPKFESVESLSCVLSRGRYRTEILERRRIPLSGPDSRVSHNREAIVIPTASLSPGDIIDLRYTIKCRSERDRKQHFSEKIMVGGRYRTLISRTVLIHPAGMPVYCHLRNIETGSRAVEKTGRKTVYRVTVNNIAPHGAALTVPERSRLAPAIYFTPHRTWDEFHAWYSPFLKDRIRADGDIKKYVRTIIAGAGAPLDRIGKIYGFVTGNIRCSGHDLGADGTLPRGADITFHAKTGDSEDVSLLLITLAREAGIDARLALIRTRDRGEAYLAAPFAGEFTRALCFINLGNGFFLDVTAADAGIRELPADDRGVNAFVIDDAGWRFINTGSDFYYPDLERITGAVAIAKTGNAEITISLLKQGSAAPETRHSLKDSSQHVRELNEYWNAAYTGSSVSRPAVSNSSVDRPVEYSYSVSVPGFAQISDNRMIFDSFITKSGLYAKYALARKRAFPLLLSGIGVMINKATYTLPQGHRAERVPADERFDHETFSAAFSYSSTGGAVTVTSNIEIKSPLIPAEEYQRFREFTRFVDRKERELIVLTR
ncbi:MAG: hypothetical protein A2176_04570 [Spirochaetes bacterium RBG_13_51_14]|nr:MAG: hypothetical protein A2176_04570 [Spirochaetes bacterium RBG_13_51_14]